MRWLIWMFVLGALAIGLVLLARLNTGYVLVVLPGHRVELSLNLTLMMAVLSFMILYLLLRLLVTMLELPGRVARLRASRRRESAHGALVDALQEFFSGRYARAEKMVNRAVKLGERGDLGAVIAARAAHQLRAPDRRDAYLSQQAQDPGKPDVAAAITTAQLRLEERRPQDALDALSVIPKRHTEALRLELRARQRLQQWDQVPRLIDQLEKREVFNAEQADVERRHAWRQLLERKAGDPAVLTEIWKRMPERYRRDTAIAAAAATAFQGLGQSVDAQAIIERSLDHEWDDGLINLYGECAASDALRQIERAEKWLKDRRENGALLLTLGRLCARQQLWGKAQSYLEASISVAPTYTAHLELAQLHERLNRSEEAAKHYRASLELAIGQLKQVGGGRRRTPF